MAETRRIVCLRRLTEPIMHKPTKFQHNWAIHCNVIVPKSHLWRGLFVLGPAPYPAFLANVNVNSRSRSLYRPSVRLSVTFVRPTQAIVIFGNIFTPFGTLAICDLSVKILRRSSQGNPSVGGVKHKRVSRI